MNRDFFRPLPTSISFSNHEGYGNPGIDPGKNIFRNYLYLLPALIPMRPFSVQTDRQTDRLLFCISPHQGVISTGQMGTTIFYQEFFKSFFCLEIYCKKFHIKRKNLIPFRNRFYWRLSNFAT